MNSYAEVREHIEKMFSWEITRFRGNILNATEAILEKIREAYKSGAINQLLAIDAVEILIALKIREEIKENVRDI